MTDKNFGGYGMHSRVAFYIRPWMRRVLRAHAKKLHISISDLIRAGVELIIYRLENNKPIWDESGKVIME